MKVFVRSSETRRSSIELGDRIGGGGAGDVYRIKGHPGEVAKIYRGGPVRASYEKKVEAMVGAPIALDSIGKASRVLHQLAWPLQILEGRSRDFQGFTMPEIDYAAALSLERLLQKRSRAKSGLPEFYGHRIVAAFNAAMLVARLHEHQHHVVDLKPVNILFYRENMQLALVDCDGFSILSPGGARHPAGQFTPEYIAPEFVKRRPSELGEEQDRFALAVIIFRLLNNGLHPYQGRPTGGSGASTLAENVSAGLYAYGLVPSSQMAPALATVHESFPLGLREGFDRAFGRPGTRPSAPDWIGLLRPYADPSQGGLQACLSNPKDHAHFGEGCGWCDLEARVSRPVKVRRRSGAPSSTGPAPARQAVLAAAAIPLAGLVRARGKRWFLAALFAGLLSMAWGERADEGSSARPSLSPGLAAAAAPQMLMAASGFPLSEMEERCVEMIIAKGKMTAGAATDYCYGYYSDHRTPATRQVEHMLANRGLDDISVRQRGGGLRVSGAMVRREDYEVLKDVLNAVGSFGLACERAGRGAGIQVRCELTPGEG